jgi:hypothetical protein
MSSRVLFRGTDLCKHTLWVMLRMISLVIMFIHEHDHILSLHALYANSRTKEKNVQKLHKLTPDAIRPDTEGEVQEKSYF